MAEAEISAQGNANVTGPKCVTAKVTAAGAPHVDLDVEKAIDVDASGAASVRWGGKPDVHGAAGVGTKVEPR